MKNRTHNQLILQLSTIIIIFIYSGNVHAKSNDPEGNIFLIKPFLDTNNCGPLVVLMARKYYKNNSLKGTIRQSINNAREQNSTYLKKNHLKTNNIANRWWDIADIQDYLKHYKIPFNIKTITSDSTYDILKKIDNNNIAIINVNMNSLPLGNRHIGKPYFTIPIPGGWGHYLLLVGYHYIDDELFFEVHDSYSRLGKNRLFKAKNIIKSLIKYNPKIIFIKRNK